MVSVLDTRSQQRFAIPEKANRPDTPRLPKPPWLRVRLSERRQNWPERITSFAVTACTTVCEEAGCPNIGECWEKRHATMMIMGDTCTRACAFCNVRTGLPAPARRRRARQASRRPSPNSACGMWSSPPSIATILPTAARSISPDRDRRPSARAAPDTTIEILTPDFLRKDGALETRGRAGADVFNHNLETVPVALSARSVPVRAISIRCACCSGSRNSTRQCSPSRASWSDSARARRSPAGDGRPALGRCRFPHHRPVSAADAEARVRSRAT